MKKLAIIALAMIVSSTAQAQDAGVTPVQQNLQQTGGAGAGSGAGAGAGVGAAGSGLGLGAIGGIATGSIVAGAIAAGVLAAVVSNNRSESPVDVEPVLKCQGTDPLVNGLCVGTSNIVSVVSSGTGTATRTALVPVQVTYQPTQG